LLKLPSGQEEYGLIDSNDPNPNWEDYMDPDEMDAFELWQQEQAVAEEEGWGGDMADPADIPLCSEFSRTGNCNKGDDCPLIHGDECENCHQYALHPYNPDLTAHHKATCTGAAVQEVDGVADPAPAEVKPDAEVDHAALPEAEGSKGEVAKVAETVAAAAADDAPPAAAAATSIAVDESAPAPAAEEKSKAAEVAEASEGLAKVTLED